MAEEKNGETTEEVKPAEVTEDDLRSLIGEVVEEKLSGISDGIGGLADSILEKLKGEGSSTDDSLLEKIGGMIDEKLKGIGGGSSGNKSGNGTSGERVPKINIFR
jgi:hypothetical protein